MENRKRDERKRHAVDDLREKLNVKKRRVPSCSPPPSRRRDNYNFASDSPKINEDRCRNIQGRPERNRNNSDRSNRYSRDRNSPPHQRRNFWGDNKRKKNDFVGFKKLDEWSKEDPLKIIVEVVNRKKGFEELLGTKLSNDSTVLVLKVLAKVLLSPFSDNKIEIVNLALKQNFISHLKNFLMQLPLQDDAERKTNSYFWNDIEGFFANLAMICEYLIETILTTACEILPKTFKAINLTISNLESERALQMPDELKQKFEQLQEKLTLSKTELEKKKQVFHHGPNVKAPPDDFRQLSIYPTVEEITTTKRAFIRSNIIDGCYENVDHYLDVHFRLLKEDFVAPLRDGICKFIGRETARNSNVKIHQNVMFINPWLDQQRVGVLLQFNAKRRGKNYNFLRRFMYGSLVCFTKDDFVTVIFGKIIERNAELLNKGQVVVGFEPGFDAYELNQPYTMVECSVYFEPYYHVLKALQKMDQASFPMKIYLIDVNPKIEPPCYLTPNSVFDIKGHKVQVLNSDSWPSACKLALDDTQYSAFKAALTQNFVVIQGPPGTGKTYLGLEIAKTLIKKEEKKEEDDRTPILVLSYTNHALDQFLEGLVGTTTDIVRVGGQSKNNKLEEFNLKIHRRYPRRMGSVTGALHNLRREVGVQVGNIKNINEAIDEIEECKGVIDFRYFVEVDPDLRDSWFASASDRAIQNWLFGGRNNWQLYVEIKQAQKEEERWQGQQLQQNPHEDVDRDLDKLLDAENRQKLEIDDDLDLEENQISIMFNNKPTYLFSISDITQAIEEDMAKLNELRNVFLIQELQQKLVHLNNDLYYLTMRLKNGRSSEVTKKPKHCDLRHPHTMKADDRWALYFYWLQLYKQFLKKKLPNFQTAYQEKYNQFAEIKDIDDAEVMRRKLVVGMTTTGAARLQKTLQELKCKTVIVEEAAEILESHIIVSLTNHCEHLILIGDHQQLRPSTADYRIEHHHKLGISLFERMVRNNIQCHLLGVQHRMLPEIAKLIVPAIYPTLENHPSVCDFPPVLGIDPCVYFIDHNHPEEEANDSSKINTHEVIFLINLARYLIQNGYKPEDITILAAYSGQMFAFWRERKKLALLLQDVRITCLDNYQGEESKIILLSLVRNNEEDRIGFLKIENRVCVALSRAREGFYMMGNMDLLCRNSEIWPKVKEVLVSQEFLGKKLTLRCQIHTDVTTKVQSAEDFLKVPEGGCKNMCEAELNCGHKCPRICHVIDRTHEMIKCKEKCPKMCENDHKCPKLCFENCGHCKVPMQKKLPCTHEETLPCYINPKDYQCITPVNSKLPCGHEVPDKPCFEDINTFECPFPCDARIEPCGHACNRKCHIRSDPDHLEYKCRKPCARPKLNCSTGTHPCPEKCCMPCQPCKVLVSKPRTICSHSFQVECNVNIDEELCRKLCKKILPCGHKCEKRCGDPCGNCQKKVEKKVTECGHTVTVKCCEEPHRKFCKGECPIILSCGHRCQNTCDKSCTTRCRELVEHTKAVACGHDFKIECFLVSTELPSHSYRLLQFCREPCRFTLECSHPCPGTCGECAQGRIHQSCKEKCGVPLICGHECPVPCRETCQPCNRQCSYKCMHSTCKKICGEPCTRCAERCGRQCRHIQCRARCGQFCTVPPCTRSCYKRLPCGHRCVGFCGDPCPPLCGICNRKELAELFLGWEDEKDAKFVLLEECGHVIESRGMEEWLQQDGGEINCKTCPRCKTPLASTQRYSDYIKAAMADVTAVKNKFYGNLSENKEKHVSLFKKVKYLEENCQKLCKCKYGILSLNCNGICTKALRGHCWKEKYSPVMTKLIKSLKNTLEPGYRYEWKCLSAVFIRTFTSKIQIIENIAEIFNKADLNVSSVVEKVTIYINFLLGFLAKQEQRITNQEIADFEREILRLTRIVELCQIEDYSYSSFQATIQDKPDVKATHEEINSLVFSPTVYTKDLHMKLKKKLEIFNKEIKANIAISDKERRAIIRAMDMKPGHWYKCPRGHYYVITECGGAMEVGKCNECGDAIGGTSHTLLSNNQHAGEMDGSRHAAWSQAANNFLNYEEFRFRDY